MEMVDDPPRTGRHHPRCHRPGDEEPTGHLRVDHVTKALRGNLPERLRIGEEARVHGAHPDPGVVDEHVEATEPLPDLADRGVRPPARPGRRAPRRGQEARAAGRRPAPGPVCDWWRRRRLPPHSVRRPSPHPGRWRHRSPSPARRPVRSRDEPTGRRRRSAAGPLGPVGDGERPGPRDRAASSGGQDLAIRGGCRRRWWGWRWGWSSRWGCRCSWWGRRSRAASAAR